VLRRASGAADDRFSITGSVPDGPLMVAMARGHVLLLTGAPGVGKTTVLLKVAAALASRSLAGFTTEEIRQDGQRVGFRIVPLDGAGRIMAHLDFRGPARVGRYGVDVAAIDAVTETALAHDRHVDIYLVDEIGKMECLSQQFIAAMRLLLDSTKPVVATIARQGGGFIAEMKRRTDVELWEATVRNRDALVDPILRWIRGRAGSATAHRRILTVRKEEHTVANRPLVIYHANCTDGLTAAWVALRALGEAEVVAAHYGTVPPNVAGRTVYIVDFSYDRPTMETLAAAACEVTILDHHKTAQAVLHGFGGHYPNARVVFDMERSGAGLAWDYFHPNEPAPWLVEYVQDRDLWRWALPDSRLVSAGIDAVEHTLQAWDALARRTPAALAAEGAAIEPYRRRCIESACALARCFTIAGHVVPSANCSEMRFASDVAHALADCHPFAATYWVRADGMVQFSIRSRTDGVDVSEIAQLYGGGGHRHAAGFEVEFSRFAEMMAGSSQLPTNMSG
jgi:nucleoside-triphosphatase THEP1/oligoribonuclease NrnB/cAMP/cGMP phosphodiesterase (DHH superfamily)